MITRPTNEVSWWVGGVFTALVLLALGLFAAAAWAAPEQAKATFQHGGGLIIEAYQGGQLVRAWKTERVLKGRGRRGLEGQLVFVDFATEEMTSIGKGFALLQRVVPDLQGAQLP